MPWTNSHLHQFIDESGKRYSDPRFNLEDVADETRTPLSGPVIKPKDWILYEYDFGDGSEHSVALEKGIAAEAKQKLPACVAGKRAAPPDDCGGIGGYAHLLDVLKDTEHEEYDDMIEWVGGPFDPAAFDPADFDRAARRLRLR